MKACCLVALATLISGSVGAEDQFSWLRDDSRSSERVLDYLEQQNGKSARYQDSLASESASLQADWRENQPTRTEKPWKELRGVEYSWKNHALFAREAANQKASVIFDSSDRADSYDYYQIGAWKLSPNGKLLAIAEDIDGSEQYQISVVDLASQTITLQAKNVEPSILWSATGESIYAVRQESKTQRPFTLINKRLDNNLESVVLTEDDSAWLLSTYPTSDARYAIVQVNNENSSEQRLLNLETGVLSKPIQARENGVEYYADRVNNQLYINSNHQRSAFQLYKVQDSLSGDIKSWKPIMALTPGTHIENFYLFESGPVVVASNQGKQQLYVYDQQDKLVKVENVAQEGGVAWVSQVGDYQSNKLHIRSMSMIQPGLWERFNTATAERQPIGQDRYPNYQSEQYVTQSLTVDNQGQSIPVTLAYRKDKLNADSSVFLYGYGAYGVTMKPYFMPQTISLLDRGVIYAIAHVRGGGYKGDAWYQAGKGLNKAQSVSDFVAVARELKQFNAGERAVYAMGSSAGGTLVAAAINQNPTLFSGASLKVPFVDVINSMEDETLPLTAQQYSEWGNPHQSSDLTAMQSYDPYFNLTKQSYPPMLVTIGLNDRRVPYWEGAKYHAKLQSLTTGDGPYLLSTNFSQGHSSDRRQSLSQQAFEYAFLLSLTHKKTKAEQ